MNILYARNTNFDFPEANKIQVINMCKAFKENGCDVTLIAFGKNIDDLENKYKTRHYFKTKLINARIKIPFQGELFLFACFLKNYKFHNYIYTRDIIVAALVKLFFKNKRVFFEVHNVPKKYWWKLIYKNFIPKLDGVIVISQGLKDGLLKLGIKFDNIIILHDGVNLSDFDIPISREEARMHIGLPPNKIAVVYVGSTDEDRDIPALIEAAKKTPDVNFIVFGKEREYLKKATLSLSNFIFKGYTNNPEVAYKAADILFAGYSKNVSTINYMSPLKIFEYMAAKRPIIVADFPRIREILDESEVYFYKDEDSNSISDMIKEILDNKAIAESKAMRAYKKSHQYTWVKRAENIITLIKKTETTESQYQ